MNDPAAKPGLQTSRLLLGFALAPMLPAFYSAMFFAQPWAFPIGMLMSYPAALLLGLPLFLILRRRGWIGWWQTSLCGLICALPVVWLYRHVGTPPHLEPFHWLGALTVMAWGAFSGFSFWLLAVSGTTPISLPMLFGAGISF
jgi:hypothetical protein